MWMRNKRKLNFRQPKIYRVTAKEHKAITINTGYIWLVMLVILLGVLVWFVFYSRFFQIKNIIVDGTINESIQKEIDTFYGQNIFLFTIGQKDKELQSKQNSIEKLNIVKGIPDTLKIAVTVRTPQIKWKTKDKIYYVDNKGIIFNLDNQTENYNNLPQVADSRNLDIKLGTKIITNDFVDFVKNIFQKVPEVTKKDINEAKINETTLYLEVGLKDGYKITFDTLGNINDQIFILKNIIEHHSGEIKEYVDLRVPNKAYYK